MREWRDIEGFINEECAAVVEKLVSKVPENGWIIEIGCYKGRQSALIAAQKKSSVLLSCIDPFPDTFISFDDSQTYKNYTYSDWLSNLQGYPNVEPVKGFSPFNISFIQFSRSPDLIIFNVDRIYDSLNFWNSHLHPAGHFLIHTYNYEHSRITDQLESFLKTNNYSCETMGALSILERKV